MFVHDSTNYLPINPTLKCGEEWIPEKSTIVTDEDSLDDCDHHVSCFNFHVTLPPMVSSPSRRSRLNFHSRERSSGTGVLLPPTSNMDETTPLETTHDGPFDPYFFERGFQLEAKTGFQVWPGSRLMLEALLCDHGDVNVCESGNHDANFERLWYWQNRLLQRSSTSRPLNILEVGSGIGVVGSCLAAAGGCVLMTDLPVLVNHGIRPNLRRNGDRFEEKLDKDVEKSSSIVTSPFLSSLHPSEQSSDSLSDLSTAVPIQIGSGLARTTTLDWFQLVSKQLSLDTCSNVDVIVACDCIFLKKIVDPLLNTIDEIFQCHTREHCIGEEIKCLFTYQNRNMTGVFIGLEELLSRIELRGWGLQCLAWRRIDVEDDGSHDLYLFEISPLAFNLKEKNK